MRLTEKYQNDYGFTKPCDDLEHLQLVADKLGQLEDIEEELGTDLVAMSKALGIINGKTVDVSRLRYAFISSDGVWYYNKRYPNAELRLTQGEFDLLKEVLK